MEIISRGFLTSKRRTLRRLHLLLATIQRLGQLGRNGAIALAALVDEGDTDFEEAPEWIADIAARRLRD